MELMIPSNKLPPHKEIIQWLSIGVNFVPSNECPLKKVTLKKVVKS